MIKIGNLEVYGIIYKIENLVNGKIYIGQTINKYGFDGRYNAQGSNVERVYNYHKNAKLNNRKYNNYLLTSIKKYGFSSFSINKIFDIAFSKEELNIKEYLWINYYDSIKNGYNFKEGGQHGRHSQESIEKNRQWQLNKKVSEETKQKHRKIMKNRVGKKVICLNTLEIFDTAEEAANKYKISSSGIKRCCVNKQSYAGKIGNSPLQWLHYSEYNKTSESNITKKLKLKNIGCKCITTGKIFFSMQEAANFYNITRTNISRCCHGKQKHCGMLPNGIKLKWEFYSKV